MSDPAQPSRDTAPAVGSPGGPASWRPADPDAPVALAQPGFGDARWSFLYGARDTGYAAAEPAPGQVAEANRRMRAAPAGALHGPFIKPPVWTWEVPLYFWVGGLASGTSFMGLACDLAGDHESARVARVLALSAVSAAPPLLIADLGRPERFLNMLRIFKPRSPMSMGAWCLVAFSTTAAGAVAADALRAPRIGRGLGAATAVLGGYLGSYTGVLLAATAVPLWARSRAVLGPIFVCTATASGAAVTRLALAARGMPAEHPTQRALGDVETVSILTELVLSEINQRRLGPIGAAMRHGRPGVTFRIAKAAVTAGVSTRLIAGHPGPRVLPARARRRVRAGASGLFLAGALAFRFAWVQAGKASAADHQVVAANARGAKGLDAAAEVPAGARLPSRPRRPLLLSAPARAWSEAVRRASGLAERMLRG